MKPADATPDLATLEARAAGLAGCAAHAALTARAAHPLNLPDVLDVPGRHAALSAEGAGLHLDFSRQRLDAPLLALLLELATQRDLGPWIHHLFAGAAVNSTERRPALHMALRNRSASPMLAGDRDVMPEVRAELERFLAFADSIHDGSRRGHGGQAITDVVNIGIGGSDLGLVMATEALREYRVPNLRLHFVSNIDGTQLADALAGLDPARTLFIICSKSFTTLETRLNAEAARRWLVAHLPEEAVGRHFVAVSVNDAAMDRFGIDPASRFRIWDWVGGRYSLWSAVGLAIALAVGRRNFLELLDGAADMDQHFRSTPLERNLPVLLGLIGVWNQNYLGISSHAVLPYSNRLQRFPAYLQQLEMESNGKGRLRDGQPSLWTTGTVLWGEPGSNAQHAFFQLLHQGTAAFSADFIAPARSERNEVPDQHLAGLANMLAQAEAFARGRSLEAVLAAAGTSANVATQAQAAQRIHPGNHPSTLLLLRELQPRSLGALIALYEHKVFVQSVIWGINPFDQWGVELGKTLADAMLPLLQAARPPPGSPGAVAVIGRLRGDRSGR